MPPHPFILKKKDNTKMNPTLRYFILFLIRETAVLV